MIPSQRNAQRSGRVDVDEASDELDFTDPGKDWHRNAVPGASVRPDPANRAAIAPPSASSATSDLSETTIFQPGELRGLLEKHERAPTHAIVKTPATGALSRSGPVDLLERAGRDAANVIAIIEWPSGATTEFSARLNIGRDGAFCPFAAEMTSELQVSRRHAVLEACAEGIRVRDLESRNGTFVNDERVPSGQAVLVDRDAQVRFGPRTVVQLTVKR